jgi:PAS domain S-box-containing protein
MCTVIRRYGLGALLADLDYFVRISFHLESALADPIKSLDTAAHLSAIVASSDDVIVSKTLEGIIMSWNPAAERIFGYTAEEAIGQHITLIIPPDRWFEEDEVLARIGRGERVDHFETIRRTKSGRLINISLTVSPVRDSEGRVVGASKVARDITERLHSEAERERLLNSEKEARELAEQANRVKDEFLAIVSHELRSPLSAIKGWASLLLGGKLDKDQTLRAIQTILRNAESQNQLIGDLLDVSRIVAGQLRLNIRTFELASVIQAALEVVRPAAMAKSIRLNAVIDPSAGPVAGDPDRLQQIFWNLLSNSIKFTPNGGRVAIRCQRINSHIEITVSDNGKGIDAKLLPVIFDRFRQGESGTARQHGGLGLGLSIVRHLVELHGGIVTARSEGSGKGAEFRIELPVSIASLLGAPSRVHPTADGSSSGISPSLSGLRILVVDDEADAREMISTIVGQAGAEVATAANVPQALDLIDRWRPDVLVSDIGMPDEDGFDLIRRVRARSSDNLGQIPAIALTAFARTQDRLKVLSSGYQMHVPKPIEPIELVTVIASITRRF